MTPEETIFAWLIFLPTTLFMLAAGYFEVKSWLKK